MNRNLWIIADVSQIVWSSVHAIGYELSYKGQSTYALFGFFSTVLRIQQELKTQNVAFCFDAGTPERVKRFKDYKIKRKQQQFTDEQFKRYLEVKNQIVGLRDTLLPKIGFKNIFHQEGYEADDLIAKICLSNPDKQMIIISRDADMFQLLRKNVTIWRGKTRSVYTKEQFKQDYGGLHPKKWAEVKAYAGCNSDEVPGIRGIGPKTAVAYIAGTLSETSKKYQLITSKEGKRIYKRNLPLVQLPYEGTQDCPLQKDGPLKWTKVLDQLGIKTLPVVKNLEYKERPK